MQCLASNGAGMFQLMCICVHQEDEELSSCLWSITHPCIVGRKVTFLCAFLWAIVIPQSIALNLFSLAGYYQFIFIYVERDSQGEKGRRMNPIISVGFTMGFTLKHKILHINISGLLSLLRLILEILPGGTRVTGSQLFLTFPCWLHLWRLLPPGRGGLSMDQSETLVTAGECCPQELDAAGWAGEMVGYCAEDPSLGLSSSQYWLWCWAPEVWLWQHWCLKGHVTSRTWNTLLEFQVLKRALGSTFAWKFHIRVFGGFWFIHELNNVVWVVQSTQSHFQEFMVHGCLLSCFIRGEE